MKFKLSNGKNPCVRDGGTVLEYAPDPNTGRCVLVRETSFGTVSGAKAYFAQL